MGHQVSRSGKRHQPASCDSRCGGQTRESCYRGAAVPVAAEGRALQGHRNGVRQASASRIACSVGCAGDSTVRSDDIWPGWQARCPIRSPPKVGARRARSGHGRA